MESIASQNQETMRGEERVWAVYLSFNKSHDILELHLGIDLEIIEVALLCCDCKSHRV